MMKYLLGGAAAAAMVAIAPAIAQGPAQVAPQAQTITGHPAGHGRATTHTRAQVATHIQTMFAKLDANRDGSITKAEAQAAKAARGQRAGKRMMRHGAPGGQGRNHGAMFDRLDANRDGSISRAEFDTAHAQRQQRRAARDVNGDGRPDARGPRGAHRMARMGGGMGLGGRMFDLADVNRDGRVTLQEATNAALRHFDTADANRDGQLTPQERMQSRQRLRAQRQRG